MILKPNMDYSNWRTSFAWLPEHLSTDSGQITIWLETYQWRRFPGQPVEFLLSGGIKAEQDYPACEY
jgi:hypothetical protein